jgi:starvation-inducible DNA-binding protein
MEGITTMAQLKEKVNLKHFGSTSTAMFESMVNIPAESRRALIELLNARLVDAIDLQSQTKFAHWNVKGRDFYQLHLLFDSIAEHLEEGVDLIAERITALGGRANGTARQAAANSSLKEYDLNALNGMEHVRALADRLASLSNATREAIDRSDDLGDKGTSDLFTEIVRTADKDLYFLESHLQGE